MYLCFAVFYDGKLRHQYFYGSRRSSGFLIAQVLHMMIIKIFFWFQKVTNKNLGETCCKRK